MLVRATDFGALVTSLHIMLILYPFFLLNVSESQVALRGQHSATRIPITIRGYLTLLYSSDSLFFHISVRLVVQVTCT